MIITIDGPALSGKSTLGRALANELGYYYLYSGILFRAIAYLLQTQAGYNAQTIADVEQVDIAQFLDPKRFEYRYDPHIGEQVFFDGIDITDQLKTPDVDALASIIATNSVVRDALKDLQKRIAEHKDVVVDGRDSGSVVFPHAEYKFYITASAQERARRMQGALNKKGKSITIDEAREQVAVRDARDMQRAIAPLIKPEGAIEVDTTGLQKHETMESILELLKGGG